MDIVEKLISNKKVFRFLKQIGFIQFPKKEKFYLLVYIKSISKAGQDEKKAILSKITEYSKRKKYILKYILMKVKEETDKGRRFSEALRVAGIINEQEYGILNSSKGGIADGIETILEVNSKASKSLLGFMLLLIPPGIMILTLLLTHGLVYNVLNDMMAPIRSAGGTPPPIPDYLVDNTSYLIFNIIYFGSIALFFLGLYYIKKKKPHKYLGIIPIIEEEYMIDILKSLQTLSKKGSLNISDSAKFLLMGQNNNIKALILKRIVERTSKGREKISEVFEEFNVNYSTISSLKIGEESNDINIGFDIAIDELESRYNRDINLFLKIGMWGGQLGMLGAAGKPMIDIMLLMSVGQLNFKV